GLAVGDRRSRRFVADDQRAFAAGVWRAVCPLVSPIRFSGWPGLSLRSPGLDGNRGFEDSAPATRMLFLTCENRAHVNCRRRESHRAGTRFSPLLSPKSIGTGFAIGQRRETARFSL